MTRKRTPPLRDEDYKLLNERVTRNEERFEEVAKIFQDDPLTRQPGILTRLSNNERMDEQRYEDNYKTLHDLKKSIRELRYEIQNSNDKVDSMYKKLETIETGLNARITPIEKAQQLQDMWLGMLSNKTTLTWVKYILWLVFLLGFYIKGGWEVVLQFIKKYFHL